MRREFCHKLVERYGAAARHHAVAVALGASVESAQSAEIAIAVRLDQKHVQLMAGDADTGARIVSFAQRRDCGMPKLAEPFQRVEPKRQIEIAAFVPDFDALAAE